MNRQHILVLLNASLFRRVISSEQTELVKMVVDLLKAVFYLSCTTPNQFLHVKVFVVLGGTAKSGIFV